MQCWLRFLFHIFIPVVYRRCPKRNIVLVRQLCIFCRGILVEKIASVLFSNEYRPHNLLTCSTDMGLLRLCKISEKPQLGWECPGVSYWVWQNFKKEKKKKEEREQGEGERERERGGETNRQRGREEGRTKQKQRKKKSKHWFAVTYCQNCDAPFFPHPECPFRLCGNMFYMFTGTSFYWLGSFQQWPGWMKGF